MSFSHHGNRDDTQNIELLKRFDDQVNERAKRAYSEGRISAMDDGDLACAITTDHARKRVIMDFGKSVTWLAMTAEDAASWGQQLIQRAREISEKPLVVEL